MSAVFFIATQYVQDRRIYWWDRINYLFHHAAPGHGRVELSYPTRIVLDLENDRAGALGTLLQLLKIQFNLDVERVLGELADGLGVAWDRDLERELCAGFVMNWDQVRELRKLGMDIGSHTRSHRALQTVPSDLGARAMFLGHP